jgi:hypothetical protein
VKNADNNNSDFLIRRPRVAGHFRPGSEAMWQLVLVLVLVLVVVGKGRGERE